MDIRQFVIQAELHNELAVNRLTQAQESRTDELRNANLISAAYHMVNWYLNATFSPIA